MTESVAQDEASVEREKQRTESEARDIIHDVERLYTFPEDKKTRWIWELLQNAKDVANAEGITISINLTQDRLEFAHNGKPFETKHLLAILYKTSTKSLNGEGGTTGKYGTGFVTTHILNKKLTIDGLHTNATGKRRFSLQIDRSAATLDESIALKAMQESLGITFSEIQAIGKKLAEDIQDHSNRFIYDLTSDSYKYAEKGLIELKRNAAFTLLINLPSNIANPIKELTESIKKIADKKYSQRVHFESHSEFGQLAKSFNTMAEKLEEYHYSNLAKLMMEKKRIETLINNLHDPIIGLDENLKVLFAKPAAHQNYL